MTPFRYPDRLHRRTRSPQPFPKAAQFKQDLRKEFNCKCVYCCMPDGFGTLDSFGVDHYLPKSLPQYAHLELVYSNLFYACNRCNQLKSNRDPKKDGHFIPNPCDHRMADYVQYAGIDVVYRNRKGEYFIDALRLNEEERLRVRDRITDYIAAVVQALDLTGARIRGIEEELSAAGDPGRRSALEDRLREEGDRSEHFRESLSRLLGCGSEAAKLPAASP
ncbi:MAG: HNH endonuclease [Acidobacteria bacterium]|nr:HNH endonuclease [Acidobacteriota bacterium]